MSLSKIKQKLSSKKILNLIKLLIAIIAASFVLNLLISSINSPRVYKFIESLGILGPLVVIFYTTFSHILAPLAGTPGVLLSLALFGIVKTMVYVYIGSLLSAAACFWISRKFGRVWVKRLVGKKTMEEVDRFAKESGLKILIIARIFGFSLFEVISYAAGLTNIKFKNFITITAIFSLIPNIIIAYSFKDQDFSKTETIIIWLATIVIIGAVFSWSIARGAKKKK